MAKTLILYSKKEHIGYITLTQPETGNAMNLSMAQELAEICTWINQDEDVYLAVITGVGKVFCSGGETKHGELSGANEEIPAGYSVADSVAHIDQPTLAVLNGDAIGEGLELALACDLRIASEKARFGLPQISDGFIPMDGGTQRLPRIVGKAKALEMVLTGEIIDARTAFEIGLVNKIVSAESLASEVENLGKMIAGKAPIALRYAKEAVNKGLDLTLEQGLRLEADLYFLIHTTADRTEGIKSFLAKKAPQYRGK